MIDPGPDPDLGVEQEGEKWNPYLTKIDHKTSGSRSWKYQPYKQVARLSRHIESDKKSIRKLRKENFNLRTKNKPSHSRGKLNSVVARINTDRLVAEDDDYLGKSPRVNVD